MSKNLVIVESPAKAKTIEKFLGKDFHVLSSQGHIRDIEGTKGDSMGIDFEKNYAPRYVIDKAKHRLVDQLRKEAASAEVVWLASDEDREGEAIAWHLNEVLKLPKERTRRIVFHEVTKTAIQEAILHPRDIDYNLVNAQQARRVMDRIVGFELSPILWRKVIPGLSAGRVQSVAVRLIVEREREIQNFIPQASYSLSADFNCLDAQGKEVTLHTTLNHRFANRDEALAFMEVLKASQFTVANITAKASHRSPAPPFTTSSLQQEASRKLRFPVSKTMRLAQSLYEAGRITYMRTDSVNLSSLAINTAKQEILTQWGEEYSHPRQFHTTSKGAQEAHEAIRPTYMDKHIAGSTEDEKKLYQLIWKRAVASQMADAEIETTKIEIAVSGTDYHFVTTGEVVLFDGFMKLYLQSNDDEEERNEQTLPQLTENTPLKLLTATSTETYTKAPFRFTDASLVKRMDELGIGRPSTYATIIETIQQRKYVERGSREGQKREIEIITLKGSKVATKTKKETFGADAGKFIPTDLGFIVNDYLVEHFSQIMEYSFTANAEAQFDEVAAGERAWVEVIDEFYQTFHPLITETPSGKMESRILGTDPKSGRVVAAKIGRRGPCIQIGTAQDDEKPLFATLPKDKSLFTITLDEALALFESVYPYSLGEYENEEMVVMNGQYGPYIRFGKLSASVGKDYDAEHLTAEQAIEIIEKKRKQSLPIHDFGEILVLNGRFGAYIKKGKDNFKIPKGTDIQALTKEDCEKIIASPQKKK